MQFEKKATMGNFAQKGKDYKAGDVLVIAKAATPVDGKYGMQYVFGMKMPNGDVKNMPFNQTSINKMIDAFGKDDSKWVGQKVKVWLVTQNVSGEFKDVVYITAPNQGLKEDAQSDAQPFPQEKTVQYPPDGDVNYGAAKDEIDPSKIPF